MTNDNSHAHPHFYGQWWIHTEKIGDRGIHPPPFHQDSSKLWMWIIMLSLLSAMGVAFNHCLFFLGFRRSSPVPTDSSDASPNCHKWHESNRLNLFLYRKKLKKRKSSCVEHARRLAFLWMRSTGRGWSSDLLRDLLSSFRTEPGLILLTLSQYISYFTTEK